MLFEVLIFARASCDLSLLVCGNVGMVQTSDVLYFEALDLPLPELQGLKTLKVAFHNSKTEEVTLPLDVNLTFSGGFIYCLR